jgi:hypothetical protein
LVGYVEDLAPRAAQHMIPAEQVARSPQFPYNMVGKCIWISGKQRAKMRFVVEERQKLILLYSYQ